MRQLILTNSTLIKVHVETVKIDITLTCGDNSGYFSKEKEIKWVYVIVKRYKMYLKGYTLT